MSYRRVEMVSLIAIGLFVAAPLSQARAGESAAARQTAQRFAGQDVEAIDYWLYLPKDYAAGKDRWPLLLFLHGSGERGDDLKRVLKHGPPKRIAAGHDYPFIVVSPQCKSDQRWSPEALKRLLDHVIATQRVDTRRIYVTGLSMGGSGTWSLLAAAPKRIAAAAPICGGGDPATVAAFKHVPLWVFHGAKDSAKSLANSRAMVAALKQADADVKFTVYPEAGHDAWTETYDNPDFYKWLLGHSLTDRR